MGAADISAAVVWDCRICHSIVAEPVVYSADIISPTAAPDRMMMTCKSDF